MQVNFLNCEKYEQVSKERTPCFTAIIDHFLKFSVSSITLWIVWQRQWFSLLLFLIRHIFQAVYLQTILKRIMYSLLDLISSLSVSILKLVQDTLTFPQLFLSKTDDKRVWPLLVSPCHNLLSFKPDVRFCSRELSVISRNAFAWSRWSAEIKAKNTKTWTFLSELLHKQKMEKEKPHNCHQAQRRTHSHTWSGRRVLIGSVLNPRIMSRHCALIPLKWVFPLHLVKRS